MNKEAILCCKCKKPLSSSYYYRTIRQKKSCYCNSCLLEKFTRRYRYMDETSVKKLMDARYTLVAK